MAEREANIDLIFRNGLKDYEVLPPVEVWENIRPSVSRRSRYAILFRAAAVFTLLLAVGSVSYFITRSISDTIDGSAITLNQDVMPAGNYVSRIGPVAVAEPAKVIEAAAETFPETEPQASLYYNLEEISLFRPVIENKSFIPRNEGNVLPAPVASPGISAYTDSDQPYRELQDIGNESDEQESRWRVGAMITPTYYSRFNFAGGDAGKELINSEKATVSYSGGVSFAYNVSKRISIQSGIYYSALGQKVTGVESYSGFRNFYESKGPGDFVVQTSSGSIISNNNDIYLLDGNQSGRVLTQYTVDVFDPVKSDLEYLNNSLHQNFNYLELPIVMRYKLFDRKIDFNLIGAISYNILLANSAFTYANGVKTFVGKTDGLSPVTFSSALGMGLEYSFSERLLLNLEPMFRYYMTPLGGFAGSSIHPYSFGILSGVSFKF